MVNEKRQQSANLEDKKGKQWKKDNARAMCIISSSVDYSQLEYLITCVNASEMWNKLCLIHEQNSKSNKLTLMKRFHSHTMNTSDSVMHHVSRILNMANQLKDIGKNVTDLAIMAKILGSLPTKFHSFATAWNNVPAREQTIERLQERLIAEERRLQEMEEVKCFSSRHRQQEEQR